MQTNLHKTLNSIPKVIENPPFEKQIEQSNNKIIARVVSWYAVSENHFEELYQEVDSKWYRIENALPEKKWETLGGLWARNIILEYFEFQKKN
jgi:hypothetical protein